MRRDGPSAASISRVAALAPRSLDELGALQASLIENVPDAVLISAEKGWGIDSQKQRMIAVLDRVAIAAPAT